MLKKQLLAAVILLLLCGYVRAADETAFFDFEKASLEDILNLKTVAASRLDSTVRETPGIITVVSRAEMINSGARDLLDVLRLVPGLGFGVDVESLLGLGVRGNWAHEGKVLFLVDGQRYNEAFFGTAQLERIPVEQLEKIEIIRGPGSSVYGGFAGLGVIKIETRSAAAIAGAEAAVSHSYLRKTYGGRTANLAFGKNLGNAEISAQAYYGDFNRGDRRYTAFDGASYDMTGASGMQTRNLNLGLKSGLVNARLIADIHRTWQRDGYSTSTYSGALERNFDAYFAELNREFRLADNLTVTPAFNFSYQEPYNGYDATFYYRDKSSRYYKYTLVSAYERSERVKFSAGAEFSQDKALLDAKTPSAVYFRSTGTRRISYDNTAFFVEGLFNSAFGNLSAGARYDKHQKFDAAYSPRLAWTKVFERLHLKAIFSRSFRAPGIDNSEINPALRPERVTVAEAEAGYKFGDDLFISGNAYEMRIKDPIVFYTGPTTPEHLDGQYYGNYGRTGTRGLELTARLKKNWGYCDLSWSHYAALGDKVAFFDAGSGSGALLAFARNKVALNSSVRLAGTLSVNPSAAYYTSRHGYVSGVMKHYDNLLLANVNFRLKDLLSERLELDLGVYNVFNTPYGYIQPYNGGHSELPGLSREVRARASYKF